ncbi:MAG: site-specific integrase [Bacteroidales bacterium]|nr:site-specific integrase [Bacteroidales bacterium]
MATFNIELNSRPIMGSNERTLLMRITVNRKHIRLNLMYSVAPGHFNPKGKASKYIRSSHPEHARINNYLEDKILQAKEIVTKLEKEGKSVTPQIIRSKMTQPKTCDLFVFCENLKNELLKRGDAGTYKKYRTILGSLKEHVKKPELYFDEIDGKFLSEYQEFLKKQEKEQTTIHAYVGRIRSLFNKAIRQGLIEPTTNPFSNYRIKQGKVLKDRLTENEIIKIEELDLPESSLTWNVRNLFLFSFYNAGIRISDILLMTWDNIKDDRLVYTMYKTNKVHSLKLLTKPLAILEKYKGRGESFIFPFFSDRYDYSDPLFLHNQIGAKTALINKYLKDISVKAKISKNVTTHTARHSFADIARQKTDNLYNLSKTLGHSSLKVTEAYLSSFDEKAVDDTLDSVFK